MAGILRWSAVFCLLLVLWGGFFQSLQAAEQEEIDAAIDRGILALKNNPTEDRAVIGLVTYTLLTSGETVDSPSVARGLKMILEKFPADKEAYQPTQHHFYEAAIDLMALAAADPEKYFPQIELIGNYIVAGQKDHGGWFYPNQGDTFGDTSISQYSVLGIWAAHRSGMPVPPRVLEKAALWHLKTQLKGGGFCYHPTSRVNAFHTEPRGTMTAAGAGSLGIVKTILYRNGLPQPETSSPSPGNPFNFLEPVNPEAEKQKKTAAPRDLRPEVRQAIEKTNQWLASSFERAPPRPNEPYYFYYFYTLERAATLNEWEKIGSYDWYDFGADALLKTQRPDGYWGGTNSHHPPADTCFSLLFLMRATQKLIPQQEIRPRDIGAGVLAGGRGLPDDLTKVEFENGKLKSENPSLGELNQVLAGLMDLELPETPKAEEPRLNVDLSDPEALIGNISLLEQLAELRDPQARQIAAWALGRTDEMEHVGLLLELLNDPDITVAIEARYALCWIARRPNGFDHVEDPVKAAEEDGVTDREAFIEKWREEVASDWKAWYLKQRPYELRDDLEDPAQLRFRRD